MHNKVFKLEKLCTYIVANLSQFNGSVKTKLGKIDHYNKKHYLQNVLNYTVKYYGVMLKSEQVMIALDFNSN